MTDIDMTGVEWTPWNFSGTFDGNGHSILNLSVKTVSKKTMKTYDGNRKEYETYGAGFFGVLTGAKVTGLDIYGARIEITTTGTMILRHPNSRACRRQRHIRLYN